jgi:hypothetical protein
LFQEIPEHFMESQNNSTLFNHEKLISANQELNNLENSADLVERVIVTSDGTILKFTRKICKLSLNDILCEHKLNDTNEILLTKNDGVIPGAVLPGAEGYPTVNGFKRRHPIIRPRVRSPKPGRILSDLPGQIQSGHINYNNPGPFTPHNEVNTGLNAHNFNNQCNRPRTPEFNMQKEFKMFQDDMMQKDVLVQCDLPRFKQLSTNPETGRVDEKSLIEARGCLQAEGLGLIDNIHRPTNPRVNLDFQGTDPNTGKTVFMDHKYMRDWKNLNEKGVNTTKFPTLEKVGYNMGESLTAQKTRYIGQYGGPESPDDVIHLINMGDIVNSSDKPAIMKQIIKGAEDAGCVINNNILFINSD